METFTQKEQGRTVTYTYGPGGAKIILDLGRNPETLRRLQEELGLTTANRISVTEQSLSVTKEEVSVTTDSLSVTCSVCGKPYTPQRATSKYCSPACRVKASRAKSEGL